MMRGCSGTSLSMGESQWVTEVVFIDKVDLDDSDKDLKESNGV